MSRLRTDDLWTPGTPLPAADVLETLAVRLGALWAAGPLMSRTTIRYNPRMRSAAGRAFLEDHRVELNPRLLAAHPEQLIPTLIHELAHVVVHARYGRVAPHGREFKTLMAAAGVTGKATHSMNVEPLRRRRYLYLHRCPSCGQTFIARKPRRDCYCTACGPEDGWDIWRAPATPKGRELLRRLAATDGD